MTTPLSVQELSEIREQVAQRVLAIVNTTTIRASVAITEQPETIPGITLRIVAENISKWALTGDWPGRALTDREVAALTRMDVPALLAEIERLTARVGELQKDSDLLNALQIAGVDNWEGYDTACGFE